MYSATDIAIANPSYVLVPLPISSKIIKDLFVASFNIVAVSVISVINVDLPAERSSSNPTLVNILSTKPISALSAGT